MSEKCAIKFSADFIHKIGSFKNVQEPYFLDCHRSIKCTIDSKKQVILCNVNLGRYVVQFIEHPETMNGATRDFSFCLNIVTIAKYLKVEPVLNLIIENESNLFVYSQGFKFPLQGIEEPEEVDIPYIDKVPFSEENTSLIQETFKKCKQKENFIIFREDFLYEKITDFLYHMEKSDFPEMTTTYKDLELICNLIQKDPVSVNMAPKYNLFATTSTNIFVMRYKDDIVHKSIFKGRKNLSRDQIINNITIPAKQINDLLSILSIEGITEFGLQIGTECMLCGKGGAGYNLECEVKSSQSTQKYILNKKELSMILKTTKKDGELKIASTKDFMIVNYQLIVLARSLYNGT